MSNQSHSTKIKFSQSELDEVYSLSSKISCAEFADSIPGYERHIYTANGNFLRYSDLSTNKVRNDLCVMRSCCPLCESNNFRFLFVKHGFDHMICNDCDLIFTQQYLDPEKTKHMEEAETGDKYGEYKDQSLVNELDRKKFEIVFKQLESHGSFKTIFDIGSAGGTFLEWASEKYSIVGHEYHKGLRNYCHKRGYDVRHEDLGTIELDQQFDLITSWDYLDHVINPKEMVANVSRFLKPGGLFFYAANNRDSLSMRMLHEHSPLILGPAHTMHFGLSQIEQLMDGFELVYAETYVSELNWLSNWLNFKNPEFGDASLMTKLLDPQKICELGMGLKLNVIFKKSE